MPSVRISSSTHPPAARSSPPSSHQTQTQTPLLSHPHHLPALPPLATYNHIPSSTSTSNSTTAATTSIAAPPPPPPGSISPVAPDYSPITPKIQPVLPAIPPFDAVPSLTSTTGGQDGPTASAEPTSTDQDNNNNHLSTRTTMIPNTYIPSPPAPQLFSSEDSTDAIALRAAISTLQFQKKKAQEDLRALESLRSKALDDPALFRKELAAGRLQEEKSKLSTAVDWQKVLDEDSDESESEVENEDEDVDMTGLEDESNDYHHQHESLEAAATVSNNTDDTSMSTCKTKKHQKRTPNDNNDDDPPFSHIPGPQNIVRMPHINWDKYHIVGAGLDQLHSAQQRWPGSTFAYDGATGRGREHVVAAPFSPWYDSLADSGSDEGHRRRSDGTLIIGPNTPITSATTSTPAAPQSVVTSISEHPMETRRTSRMH